MTANTGTTPQSAVINATFANALGVTVRDALGNPIPGVGVAFAAPEGHHREAVARQSRQFERAHVLLGQHGLPFLAAQCEHGVGLLAAVLVVEGLRADFRAREARRERPRIAEWQVGPPDPKLRGAISVPGSTTLRRAGSI